MKCKFRKDSAEEFKIGNVAPVNESVVNSSLNSSVNLEVCGVCGNLEEDEGVQDWIECELCKQWFHQDCIGINLDSNDFLCSDDCVEKDLKKRTKK